MGRGMSHNFDKLKALLQELFQLDQPDLDFGLYRVMHAKSAEVSQFLDVDLLPQVQTAFGQYKTADKADIEKELAKVIGGVEAAGMDPAQSPKVIELRARLANEPRTRCLEFDGRHHHIPSTRQSAPAPTLTGRDSSTPTWFFLLH